MSTNSSRVLILLGLLLILILGSVIYYWNSNSKDTAEPEDIYANEFPSSGEDSINEIAESTTETPDLPVEDSSVNTPIPADFKPSPNSNIIDKKRSGVSSEWQDEVEEFGAGDNTKASSSDSSAYLNKIVQQNSSPSAQPATSTEKDLSTSIAEYIAANEALSKQFSFSTSSAPQLQPQPQISTTPQLPYLPISLYSNKNCGSLPDEDFSGTENQILSKLTKSPTYACLGKAIANNCEPATGRYDSYYEYYINEIPGMGCAAGLSPNQSSSDSGFVYFCPFQISDQIGYYLNELNIKDKDKVNKVVDTINNPGFTSNTGGASLNLSNEAYALIAMMIEEIPEGCKQYRI